MTLELLANTSLASIAALGFALLLNVRRSFLIYAFLVAGIGHFIKDILLLVDADLGLATLVASTVVGFCAVFLNRLNDGPSIVFAVPAIVPLIPGVPAFEAIKGLMLLASNPDISPEAATAAFSNGMLTIVIVAAIAIGMNAPRLLFPTSIR